MKNFIFAVMMFSSLAQADLPFKFASGLYVDSIACETIVYRRNGSSQTETISYQTFDGRALTSVSAKTFISGCRTLATNTVKNLHWETNSNYLPFVKAACGGVAGPTFTAITRAFYYEKAARDRALAGKLSYAYGQADAITRIDFPRSGATATTGVCGKYDPNLFVKGTCLAFGCYPDGIGGYLPTFR